MDVETQRSRDINHNECIWKGLTKRTEAVGKGTDIEVDDVSVICESGGREQCSSSRLQAGQ